MTNSASPLPSQRLAFGLMLASGIGFAFSVSAAKVALGHLDPLQVLFWTRVIAALTLVPGSIAPRAFSSRFRQALLPGVLLGLLLFLVFVVQLEGLSRTTAANASLILGIHVVATPLLALALIREHPARLTLLGAGLCLLGIALIIGRPDQATGGDLLVFGASLLLPLHTIVIARWTRVVGARDLIRVQTVVAGILTFAALRGAVDTAGATHVLPALLLGGVLGGSLAVTAQVIAQRAFTAAQTALFLALEPLLGALIAVIWLGDHVEVSAWVGGATIVAGIVVGTRPSALVPRAES